MTMRWKTFAASAVAVWALAAGAAQAQQSQSDALVRAHDQYNQGQFDQAIRSATKANAATAEAPAAAVVLGRAHLEKYRQSFEAADLDAARAALLPVDAQALPTRDRLSWTIGMGELLYLDRLFGPAAEFFDIALVDVDQLEPGARDRLVEWWASALDQQAQLSPADERPPVYERILARAERERQRDDRSAVATYWVAAAAAGAGDLNHAWAAAFAGWVLASGPNAAKVQADLDKLVNMVIVPERASGLSPGDPRSAAALLTRQWEEMKARYTR
jgi:hypothetical protein